MKHNRFHVLSIAMPSARVLGKLRKGKKVRIMSGTGMQLIVHPSRIDPITRCFNKAKGHTIELTQEEISMNRGAEMEGMGLFDDIRRGFEDLGEKIKPVADKVGRVALPIAKDLAKKGLDKFADIAPELGASALTGLAMATGNPALIPYAQMAGRAGGKALGGLARDEGKKALDNYNPYAQGQSEQSMEQEQQMIADLPMPPRRNSPPSRSSITNPMMSKSLADYSEADLGMEIARRRGGYSSPLDSSGGKKVLSPYVSAVGQGLGAGLYAQARGRGIVGAGGNLLRGGSLPPALRSQPYASNFIQASRLPPAYSQMIKSG